MRVYVATAKLTTDTTPPFLDFIGGVTMGFKKSKTPGGHCVN